MKKILPIIFFLSFSSVLSAQWNGDGLTAGTAYNGVINGTYPMQTWNILNYPEGVIYVGLSTAGQNDLEVASGGTLNIQQGITVKFCTIASDLRITGTGVLNASGISINPILFTKDIQAYWGHISFEASTGSSVINYCTIEYGRKTGTDIEGYGGGIHANTSALTISNSTIRNNYALFGGGLFVNKGKNPAINNCYVYNNKAIHGGGGFYFWDNSSSVIKNCIFDSNQCLEPSISYYTGGGLTAQRSCSIKVVNCTFVNNTSTRPEGQALLLHGSGNSRVINSIFWGAPEKQIYCYITSASVIINCAYRGITYTSGAPVNPVILNSLNNASDGPNFNATNGSDWSIKFISPCRDAGINSYTGVTIPQTDYIGNLTIGTKDIGAYEVQYSRWTGPGTSWNTNSNWFSNMIPTSTTDIIIPSGLSAYPDEYNNPPDVTVGAGKFLDIEPGTRVTVNTLNNNGTINLYSNSTSMFSLLIKNNTGYSGSGTVNTQLYLSGGLSGTGYRRHYFAVPSQQAKTVLTSIEPYNLLLYDDSKAIANKEQGWVYHDGYPSMTGGFTNLFPTDGYSFYHTLPATATFTGASLMSSLGTKSLDWFHYGWNLVGNSLTCGINWDNVVFSSVNINRSVFYTVNGQVASYVQGGPGANGGTAHIPPLQGFFIKTIAASTSLDFDFNESREHNLTTPVYNKGSSQTKAAKGVLPLIRLAIGPDSIKDETVVWFNDEATMGYDNKFDAAKWLSAAAIAQLYSLSAGADYSINGIPFPETTVDIPLAVKIPKDGTYSIRLTQLDGLYNYNFYLKDLSGNSVTKLNEIQQYSFTASSGTFTNRFILTIESNATKIDDVINQDKNFNIYSFNNTLNIIPLNDAWEGSSGTVKVFDLTGRSVIDFQKAEFHKNSVLQVPGSGLKGVYVVEIRSGVKRYVGKVVIR